MQNDNNIAFKEWAVVCAALASGRQTIILRKGGIDEGREGFRVKHSEFWLLPTRFHQDASALVPDVESLWSETQLHKPPDGKFRIDLYAVVHEVFEVRDLAAIERLAGEHILSSDTLKQRFHYRQPGLFALAVRVYRTPRPFEIDDSPYIAGCKSWVELPSAVATDELTSVLAEADFKNGIERICRLLAS